METGRKLKYTQEGKRHSNITLVFLHGSAMTKEGLLPFAKEFKNYNCIIFDLTAHGESDGEEPTEVAQFAVDVEYSIQQLQQERVMSEKIVLLGYSMGGAIACEIAIRKKVALEGLVFLSSGGNLKDYTPMVDELKAMPIEQFKIEPILVYLLGKNVPKSEAEYIIKLLTVTKTPDAIGYGDLIASNRYDHLEACKEIHLPVLLVHGIDDNIVLPMAAIETWRAIKDSELLMIPYRGHTAIYEDKKLVRDKIFEFLHNIK